jgi:putative endonuclease
MVANKIKIGHRGEDIAVRYLVCKRFVVIKRNYYCKFGEIDIIAKENKSSDVVFFEVKTRNSLSYGHPAEAVNLRKQNKMKTTAMNFISTNKFPGNTNFRFDIIEVILNPLKINHIIAAFEF